MVKKFVACIPPKWFDWQGLRDNVEIGDYVEQDEEIATIETDKVHDTDPCCCRELHRL